MRNETALKYFPTDFLYAPSLAAMLPHIDAIHDYLASLFNGSYTQTRKTHFLDALSQDFAAKVYELLSAGKVLRLPWDRCDGETECGTWRASFLLFVFFLHCSVSLTHSLARKLFMQWESKMQGYIQPSSLDFQANNRPHLTHLNRVRAVVREHERFKVAVMRVIPTLDDGAYDAVALLEAAYKKLAGVDPFDMALAERQHWAEGTQSLVVAFILLLLLSFSTLLLIFSYSSSFSDP
jgi:hypothetical protein